ncbi:PREDICTED: glutamate receptor ionotropic, kainate 4-like [Acromyrmex echinatior]|uniref:glutamate receptor ionotropic, kainate 4-like n=1 Tax=Acromyrmex echinatior TaxID=103372 RepID=UPI000580BE4C|nr:PREDICTED: glutamate receptor ionotropic, kainate 4-like [Acromyrmex echinatior]
MSNHYLAHCIHNFVDLKERIYNNLEHQNLYVLDLNCDYAIKILRQAHSKKMFIAPMKWLLLQDRRMLIDNANITFTYDNLEIFEDLAIYPDSDVVFVRRFDSDFLQLTSVYRPSPQRTVIWENRGNWTIKNGLQMSTFDVASARRRNLQQSHLKSCLVMTNPDTINHLTDFKYNMIDPITKVNYIWILHLVNRMNATISFDISNNWGRNNNGSWDGMIGMLQRHEIDIGGTSMYMMANRIHILEYIQLYTRTGLCFVFRRPLLSTIKNIFTLPFQRNVWIATGIFLVLVFCLLYMSMKWEHYRGTSKKSAAYWNQLNISKPTIIDNLLVILGAFAQQGYSYEPYRIPSRIVTLMLLLTSLSLYAAYTANIVALLQTTTDSIKTLSGLLHSPLTLGVQDIVFNRNYFKTFQDPIRKAIVEQKVEPKGHKPNWMSLEEGVRRIRNEPFAFHGIRSPMYHIMQNTYQEEEKCGLTEIDYLNEIYPIIAIAKKSPYLEIIKNGALKLREYGLMYRDEYRIYIKKPTCSSQTGFITIGFTECYFAIITMGYGALFSIIIFTLELLWHKRQSMNTPEETVSTMVEERKSGIIDACEYNKLNYCEKNVYSFGKI